MDEDCTITNAFQSKVDMYKYLHEPAYALMIDFTKLFAICRSSVDRRRSLESIDRGKRGRTRQSQQKRRPR